MKTFLLIVAAMLLCGAAIAQSQERERPRAVSARTEGTHGQDGNRGEREHRRRPTVIIVGVPILIGPGYASYDAPPSADPYRTIDGFWYYCAEPAGYYPEVPECPNGWRLVP